MDVETGENRQNYPDEETGELPAMPSRNLETGEAELNCKSPDQSHNHRKTFKIPKAEMKPDGKEKCPKVPKCIKMKSKLKKNTELSPVLLFLIPVFFLPAVSIILSCVEISIHMWAHKKNKRMKNKNVFYQSPFHEFISEFCVLCIEENSKDKITKLQDKKNDKFTKYGIEYVRRIVT